ncbi:MAG TPA: type II toxin-antitoxin system HicA family toxin [Longimicrobium sp.]
MVRLLHVDGWYLVRTKGGHHQDKHPIKRTLVTMPGDPHHDLAAGTLGSLLRQAGRDR